jgi:hypothetical protein
LNFFLPLFWRGGGSPFSFFAFKPGMDIEFPSICENAIRDFGFHFGTRDYFYNFNLSLVRARQGRHLIATNVFLSANAADGNPYLMCFPTLSLSLLQLRHKTQLFSFSPR